ncbi:MAG: hypothetical protein IJM92_11775 [Fibrobacter sp.]|uniref:FISUMP domain-containing protein n=1 Tax=Fibrobacter sp. TaxID=35828 RepID=UPI0025B9A947|nr:FISUMP domain-containing protein [Fibrobacter sp.]MBQ7080311.1 hypothetical protein [Fibrobacter sp.]
MQKQITSLLAGVLTFLIFACSDENPTVFPAERIADNSSSFFINELSSSEIVISSSSNFEASSSSWEPYSYGELIDNRDRHVYKTIKIGDQTWMAENLNFDYHNRMASVLALTLPSLCYNNSRDSCAKYGRLYSWSTAMDSAAVYGQTGIGCGIWRDGLQGSCKNDAYNYTRGACPENWHIPNESDINNFIKFAKESPKNIERLNHYWLYGENENTKYELLSQYVFFWSSIESDSSKAMALGVIEKNFNQFDAQKQSFYFIRCVKDEKPLIVSDYGTMTDERDGQVYKTVKIGNQWWMAENLNYAYIDSIETDYNRYDSASVCYNNAPDSCAKYGRLYMWDAAMDCKNNDCFTYHTEDSKSRGICPEKWHIPSVNEWKILIGHANNLSTNLKSTSDWLDDGNGSDVFGFNLLPAGFVNMDHPKEYRYIGNVPNLGTSLESAGRYTYFATQLEWTLCIPPLCDAPEGTYVFSVSSKDSQVIFERMEKNYAVSVRCVKDE